MTTHAWQFESDRPGEPWYRARSPVNGALYSATSARNGAVAVGRHGTVLERPRSGPP